MLEGDIVKGEGKEICYATRFDLDLNLEVVFKPCATLII